MSINEMPKMASSSVPKWHSSSVTTKIVNNLNPICQATQQLTLKGKFVIIHNQSKSIPGKFISVQIYSGTDVDPETGKGKLSEKAHFKQGESMKHSHDAQTTIYKIKIHVDSNFGSPRAFVIQNKYKKKFFLQSASIETSSNRIIHYDINSWIYPIKKTKSDRLFFSNRCYLPSQTPRALVELRKEELDILRGNGMGERKEWDRIYDYDFYNDLGDPEKGPEHLRPVLGGTKLFPYPRRGRTGRKQSTAGPSSESRPQPMNFGIYVPSDERFAPNKLKELKSNCVHAMVHFLSPKAELLSHRNSANFQSFEELLEMFSSNRSQIIEGWMKDNLKKLIPIAYLKEITIANKENHGQLPIPQIIFENELAWKDDIEFGRQMLAGTHPTRIQCLTTFPPQNKYGIQSSIKKSIIEQKLEGWTLSQAMEQGRIFMLDHHDYLIPYLNRINANGVCAYASRTLLFLRTDGMLKPLAIELSLPGPAPHLELHRVFLPAKQGTQAALWQLAKAHVLANDAVYHQLISHWLCTHAVVEPFIIATKRRLSVMHPIHRLLNPHFKGTMHINALARLIVINSGGILERILFPGEICMQISCDLYKEWRFIDQGLPADLLKRGMAVQDPDMNNPTGIQLLLLDYPYATDGLEIWVAIKEWVKDFCSFFYKDNEDIEGDVELQAWWSEIRTQGHGDKHNDTWWNQMTTLSNLVETLTILVWIASAKHASLNYGQYAYSGYPPNRPTLCRKFVPLEGTVEFGEFLKDPDKFFLKMLPDRFEMSLAVALVNVLSSHTCDEVYLGCQQSPGWIDNEVIQNRFAEFKQELKEIQARIMQRNRDPKLKNRRGPANIEYTLLYPDAASSSASKRGITGRGIPNSISI
ncbi:probable linoleate 9S-lipoxygenase 5 [Vigna umbellata]|uniref:probable linoleate 9S-lipoxygenase 5 n=1 Tax=Vigna umbellata TaxID=87088 RepID=UPI001F5EB7E4|nr:probable linoleate 9S-lipoxygenase 5 [Vigna umbellata]